VQRGYEFNNPLLAVVTDTHKGSLPATHSLVRIDQSNLILSSIKIAEDGDGWIVQWYESLGRASLATVEFPVAPKAVFVSNVLEEKGELVPVDGRSVVIETKANSTRTIRVRF
jgi:alpha-mannosidase